MIRRLDIKIVLMLLATALLPLSISVYLVAKAVETSLGVGLNQEISSGMEQGVEIHRLYIELVKDSQKVHMEHLMDSAALEKAAASRDEEDVRRVLERFLGSDPCLRRIRLSGPAGRSVEVKAVNDPTGDELRTLTREEAVEIGPYTSVAVTFGIDAHLVDSYADAGERLTTYQALVSAPPSYLNTRVIMVYLVMLAVIFAVSIALGIFWTRRLIRRIQRLSAATSAVAAGDLSVKVDPGAQDEVGDLVESFNSMVAELSLSRARIEYLQKISAWQEMARRLAHEIKNPLTPIQLSAQQLKEKYDGDDPAFSRLLTQSTEIIEEEVATLRRLTSDFSSFARLPQVVPERVSLQDFLGECEASFLPVADVSDVTILWEVPDEKVDVLVDRMMMKRVVDNLTRNASEALFNAGVSDPRITVRATLKKGAKQNEAEIRVEDNGPGIAPEHHPSIFDPYFTTKNEGTGLGLAISKKIVLEHGGRIWVDEEKAGGAAFIIALPTAP